MDQPRFVDGVALSARAIDVNRGHDSSFGTSRQLISTLLFGTSGGYWKKSGGGRSSERRQGIITIAAARGNAGQLIPLSGTTKGDIQLPAVRTAPRHALSQTKHFYFGLRFIHELKPLVAPPLLRLDQRQSCPRSTKFARRTVPLHVTQHRQQAFVRLDREGLESSLPNVAAGNPMEMAGHQTVRQQPPRETRTVRGISRLSSDS